MKINSVELELNYMEEHTNKRTIKAIKKVREEAGKADQTKKLDEKIAIMCGAIKDTFDSVFGQGTGVSVCGAENDLQKHADAYAELMEEIDRQGKRLNETTARIANIFPDAGEE
ncbi:MAG: hypothetical protein KH828_07900 [Clostridiales bacterium]|nr:hypothetical protein [Clostridiales bacterium]